MSIHYNVGEYWVEITDHGIKPSKEKHTPQLCVRFIVKGPPDREDPGDTQNPRHELCEPEYEREAYVAITQGTIKHNMPQEMLDGLGFVGTFTEFNENGSLVGQFVKMWCKHEPHFQTKEPREVWQVSRGGGGSIEKIETKEASRLDKLFGKHMPKAAVSAPETEAKTEQPASEQATPTGQALTSDDVPEGAKDDIPFNSAP